MQLNNNDWYILLHLAAALVHFKNATIALQGQAKQGQFGTIGECIPVIEALSIELTELQTRFLLNMTFA